MPVQSLSKGLRLAASLFVITLLPHICTQDSEWLGRLFLLRPEYLLNHQDLFCRTIMDGAADIEHQTNEQWYISMVYFVFLRTQNPRYGFTDWKSW
jgi:hypothetical protein